MHNKKQNIWPRFRWSHRCRGQYRSEGEGEGERERKGKEEKKGRKKGRMDLSWKQCCIYCYKHHSTTITISSLEDVPANRCIKNVSCDGWSCHFVCLCAVRVDSLLFSQSLELRKKKGKTVQSKKEEPKKTVKSECCPAAYMLVSDLLLWATVQWRNFRVLHRNTVVGLLQRGESRNNYIVCCLHIYLYMYGFFKKIKCLVWGLRPLLMPSLFVWCMIDAKEVRGTKSDVHITLPEKEWRNQGDLSVMKSLYFSWSPLRLIIRLVNASW